MPPLLKALGRFAPLRVLDATLLAIGAALRLWQYLADPSLFVDELALALNFVDRSLAALLLRPLDFDQVAPKGFLLAEKIGVTLGGDSEYVLRAFPLLCALVSLLLFYLVASRILPGPTATLALALFVFSPPLISHGLEVKQYSSDIAASLLLTYFALRVRLDGPSRARCLTLGVASAILVWLSQPAVFVVLGLGLALVLSYWKEGRGAAVRALLLPGGALAGASALLSLLASSRSVTPATLAYMHCYWRAGFAPLPPHSVGDVLWLGIALGRFFRRDLHFYWPALYMALFVMGVVLWIHRKQAFTWLLLAPVLLTIGAAIAHQYPFSRRLILFLVPCLLLAIAEGAAGLSQWVVRRPSWGPWALAGLLLLPAVAGFVAYPPVYRTEEPRPVLAYIEQHHRPGDALYVFIGARHAFRFYGHRYRIQDLRVTVGGYHRDDPRAYLRELDQLRGHGRVWILFARTPPIYQEEPIIVGYLERIGTRLDAFVDSSRVATYLYDLGDPVTLAASSADTYPLPHVKASARPNCRKPSSDAVDEHGSRAIPGAA